MGKVFLKTVLCFAVGLALSNAAPQRATSQEVTMDKRGQSLRDPDHFELRMKKVTNLEDWRSRREEIRQKLLLCSGLWPEPSRPGVNAKVFDERKGDGFIVAKVYFESVPGFMVTGNLYRPSEGMGPFPAVLSPHGHWKYGRLNNDDMGSIPGRCIDFARMGFVVFSIDMIGYNDSYQFPHVPWAVRSQMVGDTPVDDDERSYHGDFNFPDAILYGFNLGGMQLWNNIRALDLLCSLSYVDKERIGVTGASGGATQTLFLMTVDDRVKVAAPVNIIGAAKHPGCRCENMPGLWIDTSTVEMCGVFAPKPLLLMSATEDPWTDKTPERELPMIKKYYDLYNAGGQLKNVHIKAAHNYNADTRAAVYEWFCTYLKNGKPPLKNPAPIAVETKALGDIRVFPQKTLPENALTAKEIIANWKSSSERVFESMLPASKQDMKKFVDTYRRNLINMLCLDTDPKNTPIFTKTVEQSQNGLLLGKGMIGVENAGRAFGVEWVFPSAKPSKIILAVYSENRGSLFDETTKAPAGWVSDLAAKGYGVFRVKGYVSGELSISNAVYDTCSMSDAYNRNNLLNGIQDIYDAIGFLKTAYKAELTVIGLDKCGVSSAFAAAASGRTDGAIIDLNGSDPGYDGDLQKIMPVNGIKRIGDIRSAFLILAEKPLTVFDTADSFDALWYNEKAKIVGIEKNIDFKPKEKNINFSGLFRATK